MLFYGKRTGAAEDLAEEIAHEQEAEEAGRAVDELLEFRPMFSVGTAPVIPNGDGRDVFLRGELRRDVVEGWRQAWKSTQTRT